MSVDLTWLSHQFPELSALQPLATGGQKTVFSANHATDGNVVLKLILKGQDPERTAREIEAAGKLQGARVPQVLAKGTLHTSLGDIFWVREQRIQGRSLRDHLAQGPLSRDRLLALGIDVLSVLSVAEDNQIVHRDIKPDNLVIDPRGQTWVLDFGLARHLDQESLTATGQHFGVGTPGYAPPEQFRNKKVLIDSRTDLFGLGITLFESATGTNPYRDGARDVVEIIARTERLSLPALGLPWDTQGAFADLVSTLAQRRRDHRPRNIKEALRWAREVAGLFS